MQTTLNKSAEFIGHGLHTGRPVRLSVRPAPAGHGIVFQRVDVRNVDPVIPALWNRVIKWPLNTRLENADGVQVSTIEHLMAAFAGLGVHNALCVIDGPELPILDGSSAPFVHGLLRAGLHRLPDPLSAIRIEREVRVEQGDSWALLRPAEGLEIDFTIDFPDAAIGHQHRVLDMRNGAFLRELCNSRTFCRQADVDDMKRNGLALGGNYDNAVVVDGEDVLSPGGLRHQDEAVRHKMLDALGDLYTAGAPIQGCYVGYKSGHGLTNQLLQAVMAQTDAWQRVEITPATAAHLPGAGVVFSDLADVA